MKIDISSEVYNTNISKPSFDNLVFGKTFAPFMFTAKYKEGKGWFDAKIETFKNFSMSPASLVFHYGQEIFEGQKVYAWQNGEFAMFRPEENIKRMNKSADRMCMANIDENMFMEALKLMAKFNKDFVPPKKDYSLYIRPTLIATDSILGVRAAKEYLFYIIASPVGPYFNEGFKPVKIWVSTEYVRAVAGGTGEAKTGGNYAASLKAMEEAEAFGCSQVLWLDGQTRSKVEEVGTMNIFFVENGTLITPKLSGGILEGITRKSIIEATNSLGINFEERELPIDYILKSIENGSITEAFGAGTACVVSPIGTLVYKTKEYNIKQNEMGKITKALYDEITLIQYGEKKDSYNWMKTVYDSKIEVETKTVF